MIGRTSKVKSLLSNQAYDDNEDAPSFIFYSNEKKFAHKIEFLAVLNKSPSKKVLVVIDGTMSLEFISIKIAEAFEQYPEYSCLEGLRAINLNKKTKEIEQLIPNEGIVKNYINNEDYIFCDLIANQCWLKSIVKMKTTTSKYELTITLGIKVNFTDLFNQLKLFLIKCGINCWLENLQNINQFFTYVIHSVTFQNPYNDKSTMKDLFSFETANTVQCTIVFNTIEEYLFMQFKEIHPVNTRQLASRLHEFQESSFKDFKNEEKYQPEYEYIKNKITSYYDKQAKENQSDQKSKWYLYSRTKLKGISRSVTNEDMSNLSNSNDKEMIITILSNQEEQKFLDKNKYDIDKLQYFKGDNSGRTNKNETKEERRKISLLTDSIKDNNSLPIEEQSLHNSNTKNSQKLPDYIAKNRKVSECSDVYTESKDVETNNDNDIQSNAGHLNLKEDFEIDNPMFSEGDFNECLNNYSLKHSKKTLFEEYRVTSRYLNLCSLFEENFDLDQMLDSIETKYKPKIALGLLEFISIPEFRDFRVLPNNMDYAHYLNDGPGLSYIFEDPIILLNKRVMIFIGILLAMLITAILLLFILDYEIS